LSHHRQDGGGDEEEDEEEEGVRMVRPAYQAAAEVDDDFEREFSQLMLDYQGRPAAAGAAPRQPGLGAAAGLGGGGPGPLLPSAAHGAPSQAGDGGEGEAVSFRVMMKRGGKDDRTRELHIPLTAGMAAHLRLKEEQEAAEKAELKRLVLAANTRDQQVRALRGWHVQCAVWRLLCHSCASSGARGRADTPVSFPSLLACACRRNK
jgi:regulator of nonsense transcripts 2